MTKDRVNPYEAPSEIIPYPPLRKYVGRIYFTVCAIILVVESVLLLTHESPIMALVAGITACVSVSWIWTEKEQDNTND